MSALTRIALISSCLFISSALWHAIAQQYILITSGTEYFFNQDQIKNKEISLRWYQDHEMHEDTRMVLWSEQAAERIKNIVNGWLAHLQEENLIATTLHVESVALTPHDAQALINLSEPLFSAAVSMFEKASLLEGLLVTLRLAEPTLAQVRFLVHNIPAFDEHIDLSQSFPTSGFFATPPKLPRQEFKPLHALVINPAGDSKNTGRIINREFERTLTLDAATLLAELLKNTSVTLTRSLGQTVDNLHILHMVNQRPTDLFIDLRCYHTTHIVPEIYVYSYCVHPETDFWQKKSPQLALVPISKTYLKHAAASYGYAARLSQQLSQETAFRAYPALALPVTPLVGLTQPSIIIECGIRDSADLSMICHKLAEFLE